MLVYQTSIWFLCSSAVVDSGSTDYASFVLQNLHRDSPYGV